jgi:signal peptidase II
VQAAGGTALTDPTDAAPGRGDDPAGSPAPPDAALHEAAPAEQDMTEKHEANPAAPGRDAHPAGDGTRTEPQPEHRRQVGLLLAIAAGVLTLDVVTKVIVVATLSDRPALKLFGGLFYLTEARNAGAAYAFAQGATVLFTAIAALVVVVILRTARQLRSVPWAVSLGLILGGATGNLVDRLFRSPGPFRGRVVDWISFMDPSGQVFPIFNAADSGITVGGILAVLLALAGREFTGGKAPGKSAARGRS